MRTKPEFLEQQPRGSFALYVRNTTAEAVSISVPFGSLDTLAKMTEHEHLQMKMKMRRKYAADQPIVRFTERPPEMEPWRLKRSDNDNKPDQPPEDKDLIKPSKKW